MTEDKFQEGLEKAPMGVLSATTMLIIFHNLPTL